MPVPEGYIGFGEELPGANTQGDTLDETRENLIDLCIDEGNIGRRPLVTVAWGNAPGYDHYGLRPNGDDAFSLYQYIHQ